MSSIIDSTFATIGLYSLAFIHGAVGGLVYSAAELGFTIGRATQCSCPCEEWMCERIFRNCLIGAGVGWGVRSGMIITQCAKQSSSCTASDYVNVAILALPSIFAIGQLVARLFPRAPEAPLPARGRYLPVEQREDEGPGLQLEGVLVDGS